jgi:virginiamycin B lyase
VNPRALTLAALLAVASTGAGNATPHSAGQRVITPHVTEFGGTFGSGLGGIALARDGSLWVKEHDRIAHVAPDGHVHEYRLPIDVYQDRPSPDGPIRFGPGGDLWFSCGTCAGRISSNGRIRLYGTSSPRRPRYLTAFTVSRKDVWFAYFFGVPGIVHIGADGVRTSSDTDLERIIGLAATPDGALWIAASSRSDATVTTIYRRPPGGARQRVLDIGGRGTTSLLGTTPSGALLTARFEWQPERKSRVDRIEPDGRVVTLTGFPAEGYALQIGGSDITSDGSMWIAEPSRHRIVRVAPDGAQSEFRRGLPESAAPAAVVGDGAGGAWFTDYLDGLVGHVDANGTIRTLGHGPIPESTPALPVIASDGAVWYRESFDWRRRLVRLASDGTLREFPSVGRGALLARGPDVLTSTLQGIVSVAPDGSVRMVSSSNGPSPPPGSQNADENGPVTNGVLFSYLTGAATAPDGSAWFATVGELQRVDRNGARRTVAVPGLTPDSVAFDAKGTLWFTDTNHSLIGSVTPDGRVRTHTRGLTRWNSGPQWIVRGPDGAMWFTEVRDRIGRIAPDGRIAEFARGIPYRSSLGGIVTGPDGALWFTLWHGNVIGRMTTGGAVTLYRGLVTPSRGHEHDPDAVLVPDGHSGFWFNESQGGRVAHLTFR